MSAATTTTESSNISELIELLALTSDTNHTLRYESIKLLTSLPISIFLNKINNKYVYEVIDIIKILKPRISDLDSISHITSIFFINLTAESKDIISSLIKSSYIEVIMEYILDKNNHNIESQLLLLSNITAEIEGSDILMQANTPIQGLYISQLIDLFICNLGTKKLDQHQFIANILVNISQTPVGRKYLLDEKRNLFYHLKIFINSDNLIRKVGILRTIRNCSYERRSHGYLVSPELGLLEAVCVPILGNEEIKDLHKDKLLPGLLNKMSTNIRDPNPDVRELCVEIIHYLVVNKTERTYLRSIEIVFNIIFYNFLFQYPILRELHKWETVDRILGQIEDVVQYFLLDEGTENDKKMAAENAAIAASEPPRSVCFIIQFYLYF